MAGKRNLRAECELAVREDRWSDLPDLVPQMAAEDPFRFYYASFYLPLAEAIDSLFEAMVRRPNWRTPFQRLAELGDFDPADRALLNRGLLPDHLLPARFTKSLPPVEDDLEWRSTPEETPIPLPEPLGRLNHGFKFVQSDKITPLPLRSTVIQNGFVYWDAQLIQGFEDGCAKHMGAFCDNQDLLRACAPHLMKDAYFNLHFDETVHLIGSPGPSSFYHWLLYILPLLGAARTAYPEHKIRKICTNGSSLPFQRDSLKMIAPDAEIIEFVGPRIIHAPKIIYTFHKNGLGKHVPQWAIEFLRGLRTEAPIRDNPRLYIGRRDASGRSLQPATDVEEVMRQRGFRVVYLEDYDLQQQFALFAGADVVVSAHGAGLCHTLFMRPGSVLVEVFGDHMTTSFRYLAGRQGVHYIPVSMVNRFGDVGKRTSQERNQSRFAVIEVDMGKLTQALDLALLAVTPS